MSVAAPRFVLPDRDALRRAARVVYASMPPTPQYRWPLLDEAVGTCVWLKHENHTPVGAFKVRGGLVWFDALVRGGPRPPGVISATRGNHGQSVAFAARAIGLPVTIVVPEGNSREKNAAMRALGATLVESGADFQAAREHAAALADAGGLRFVPSFHPDLVAGVGTYSIELLQAVPQLDVLYVPIGLGSGLCGALAAREALGHPVEIVGVTSADAPAYARSLAAGRPVEAPVTTRIADGLACRVPEPAALETMQRHAVRVVEVGDHEVAAAMRLLFSTTHQVAEGAGAAAVAAVMQERDRLRGRRVAAVVCGANVDRDVFARVLAGADH
ncbi:MAG: threonine dehydratase [Burkholderiales bacterium]|jgi:threonine dehydratase|nr:threonine dehydratase [Burkholderiales bacterium]